MMDRINVPTSCDSAPRPGDAYFLQLFEAVPDAVLILDRAGDVIRVNRSTETLFGQARAELLGLTIEAVFGESCRAPLEQFRRKYFQCPRRPLGACLEAQALRRDGSEVPVEVLFSPLRSEIGEQIICVVRDLSERTRAEQDLRIIEERLKQTAEFSRVLVAHAAFDGRWLKVPAPLCRLLGYAEEELLAGAIQTVTHPENVEADLSQCQQLSRGAIASFEQETRYVRKDGGIVWVRLACSLAVAAAGTPAHFLFHLRDISVRKRLEEQVRQAQKMEAVGRLAGGIVHDFNNLLTVINGYSDLLIDNLQAEDASFRVLREIRKAGERAAALTGQLLAFSRKQIPSPRALDLNAVVRDLEKMFCRLLGEDIELALTLDPALDRIHADLGQIEQVLMNLAVNARDAMPTGGRLTIETRNVAANDDFFREHPEIRPHDYVRVLVSDTGQGMDEATRLRIFEPFFTTKELGTGLGLATVHAIVQQCAGFIAVHSAPGLGADFHIYLPRRLKSTEHARTPSRSVSPRGSESILLVEDEAGVRQLCRLILESNGYAVHEAAGGDQALEVARRHPIHLLVADVVMARMNGRQVADQVKILHPHSRILFLSGYTDDTVLRHGIRQDDVAFLQKPFTPSALARKVREVLDQ